MKNFLSAIISITILLGLIGCEDPDYPDSLWDPNQEVNSDPVISQVVPANMTGYTPAASGTQTYSGVGEITLIGENFSDQISDNLVFFNSTKGEILDATTTDLTVLVPNIEGDSIQVKVSTLGAYLYSNTIAPFKLMPVYGEIGGFIDADDINAVACDTAENVFASVKKDIFSIAPDSTDISSDYASFSASGATAMRFGPGGYLYFVQTFAMFRIGPAGASDPTWLSLFPRNLILKDLDFDQYGHLYTSGSTGDIYRVDTDTKTATLEATLDSVKVAGLKVFQNDLYLAGKYFGSDSSAIQEGVWKLPIAADGTLGAEELVLDWFSYTGKTFENITGITFAADGKLFLSANGGSALTVMTTDGILQPFYQLVLSTPINKIVWGTGDFLYANYGNLGAKRLLKINMGEPGAPYYGRD